MAEVIVALDQPTEAAALTLVDVLDGPRWVKVGATLFAAAGPSVVTALRARDIEVFLDLKWHDIPHQVEGAVSAAADLGVALATVHALGGPSMLEAAARAAASTPVDVVAVTVLTSHTAGEFGRVLGRPDASPLRRDVERLTALARDAGLAGVVASAAEAAAARGLLGSNGVIVVPGIRLAKDEADDHRRTTDPARAVAAGATHLVVGRSITRAKNPLAVYQQVLEAVT